jgi:hypothetical protein
MARSVRQKNLADLFGDSLLILKHKISLKNSIYEKASPVYYCACTFNVLSDC